MRLFLALSLGCIIASPSAATVLVNSSGVGPGFVFSLGYGGYLQPARTFRLSVSASAPINMNLVSDIEFCVPIIEDDGFGYAECDSYDGELAFGTGTRFLKYFSTLSETYYVDGIDEPLGEWERLRFLWSDSVNGRPVNWRVKLSIVPEPATWTMLISGFGLVGLAVRRRRREVFSS